MNPPSAVGVYDRSKIRVAITSAPFITLATLAGELLSEGHEVEIADLMVEPEPMEAYRRRLESLRPEYVGITYTTPLYHEARQLAGMAREVLPGVTPSPAASTLRRCRGSRWRRATSTSSYWGRGRGPWRR